MPNKLLNEKSPYLIQHAYNPVNWYPWSNEAFEKAKREDKPIFLSIGYSTCHWCHVMAHESFEDNEVADILNGEYVCIKVDREERPDIDSVYMSVCHVLTGSAGWPLSIIMTPEKKPFFAGTYFPKYRGYQRPGFMDLLINISDLWKTDRCKLLDAGEQILDYLQQINYSSYSNDEKIDISLINKAYNELKSSFDKKNGGFGPAPKFPMAHNLLFLMYYSKFMNDTSAMEMAEKTLTIMSQGGICDQIGGGFSRYSTDEKWLIPHFEKMLYDNALLIIAYLEAYLFTKNEQFKTVAKNTADYILRELTDEKGGFYCGQDADSEGVEGKYYVFTPDEIINVLGETDGNEFCKLYDITVGGNFEGFNIPNLLQSGNLPWAFDDIRLQKLLKYRKTRTTLHKDDKILLSWNSWMIYAMSMAGTVLKDSKYLNAAEKAQEFIVQNLTDNNGHLFVRYREGEAANNGLLDDYAVYSLSLIQLYKSTFNTSYLKLAINNAEKIINFFNDNKKGGFYLYSSKSEQLIFRPKEVFDSAIPSGNSVTAMVFEELSQLTGEIKWRKAADKQHSFMASQMKNIPSTNCFALIAAAKSLFPHKEIVCVSNEIPTELIDFISKNSQFNINILFKSEENSDILSQCAPFTADYPISKNDTLWYFCEGNSCKNYNKTDFNLDLLKN